MLPEPSNLRSPPTKRGRTESAPTESEPGPSGEQSTGAGAPGIPNENSSRANGNAGAQPSESVLARVQTQPTRVTGRVQRQNWSTDELARVCQEYRELKESTGGVEAGGPAVWFGKLSERYNRVIESVNRAYGLNLPARNWSSIRSKLQRDKAADRIFDKVWDRVVVNPDGETVILDDPENSSEQIEDHRIGEAASAAEPTTTASSPDTEWVIDDEFRENFNHFVATWMGKTRKVRKPIKFPRKVPEVLWKHANHLVAEHVANGTIRSLADLNRTVYAASCTVAHVLKLEDKKCAQREKDWFAAREAEIKNLSRYLNWIDVELTRRRQSQRLTPRQKRHVVELRLRYGRDRVADTTRLIELKSMLRDVLAMTRRSVMRRRADRDRKRGKFVPLRKYLESGESRDDPALRVDEIREYWAGIVGESQRSQSDAITAEWAQDCNVSAQEVTDEQLRVWWRMAVSKCKPNKAPGPDGIPGVSWKRLPERYNRVIESVNRAYGLNLPARNWSSIRSKLQRDKAADRIFDKVWDRVVVNPDGETVILDDPENSSEQIEDHRIGEAASAAEPTTTASSPDTEWVIDDEFRENFNHFVATWMGKTRKVRKPIKFPRKVPEVLWKHANHLVAEHVANGTIRSLADLNRTVYAASCTVAHVLKLEDKKCAQREKDWFAAREAEIKNLSRYLNWIDVELTRRRQSQRLTPRQKRHVVELRLRYGRDRVADTTRLIELKSMLRDVLAMTRRSVMRRRADRDRKRGKFVPLRKYLESGESRDDPALRVDEIREYWAGIVGESQRSQSDAITAEWAQDCNVSAQEVTDEQLRVWWRMAVSKCKPNKAPGPDGIPGVSWKRLPCASDWLCTWLINALRSVRVNTPGWLAHGRVVLLYKKGDASDPANYRPIACLNTCYKLITSVIEKAIREQVSACPQLLPREQIANRKGVWGCTHASIVDRMVTGSARVDKGIPGGLRVLFYDCQKAFDSVLRDHMFKVLEVAKIDRKLLLLMKSLTMNWTVRYELRRSGHTERSNPLRVRRGLLQGDTLSPTWFCLCIAPISKALRDANPGPQFRPIPGRRDGVSVYVGHMFYMDDLKVYCAGERAQVAAERLVPELFSRIGMNINASKSAAASLSGENTTSSLPVLGVKDQYKYLGIESGFVAHEVAAYARMEKAQRSYSPISYWEINDLPRRRQTWTEWTWRSES
uniref:Reverse transcriptase domain-containing protein n=1 Tax=Bursaphelenchus xylophilus TaxID=6326 RepID=A0A1I7S6I6_BURXY